MSFNCSDRANPIDSNTVSIKYVVGGWLTLIFCVFGIITNIFTVIVLMHPRMRNSSTHVYLMSLSGTNIFLLIGLMINYSIKSIASYPELLAYLHHPNEDNRYALLANGYEQFYARVAPFTTPLLSMLLLCSTYFTVLVSGDRYFLICWPSIAEKIRTRQLAIYSVLLVFIVINIYIFPHWFEYHTAARIINRTAPISNLTIFDRESSNNNLTTMIKLVEIAYTKFSTTGGYLSIYRVYLNIPITFVIPFTLLTLCNGSMIHKLFLIKKKKKRLGQRMKADIRITTMLIVIVLTFMLCRSINLFVNLLVAFSPCLNKNSLQRFNAFANLLIAFNGFINFFLFAAFGQRFREMVFYIFFHRGQYPFLTASESVNACRAVNATSLPSDNMRRPSRRFSTNDSEILSFLSRRRPSATMAAIYNTTDERPRSASQSTTYASHLHIPAYPDGMQQGTSNSSINLTESPFPNLSFQQTSPIDNDNNNLTIENHDSLNENSSPMGIKKKTIDAKQIGLHRVTFI